MTLIATTPDAAGMHAWHCALLICLAGAAGGAVNAIISANGFVLPKLRRSSPNTPFRTLFASLLVI